MTMKCFVMMPVLLLLVLQVLISVEGITVDKKIQEDVDLSQVSVYE